MRVSGAGAVIALGGCASGRLGGWTGQRATGPGEREGGRMQIDCLKMILRSGPAGACFANDCRFLESA